MFSTRPTWIEVDLLAIEHNYRTIARAVAPAKVMPVLKANAYGHGMIECARVLVDAGADSFGVAFLEEGIALREAGVTAQILALGGICGRQLEGYIEYGIDIAASSADKLSAIDACALARGKRARIHLKIDTGMERIGTHYYSAEKLLRAAAAVRHCDIVGIFTHCARAEEEDTSFTALQLDRFRECISLARQILPNVADLQCHMANSGAVCTMPETYLDVVRPGLLLYGYTPLPQWSQKLDLKPAMKLRSEVVFFKVVEKGAGVSYDHTWHAPQQTRIVTVPIGYGDGYQRRFSNKASVLIRGKRYPIVGKVCMDQFLSDIGWDTAYNGDEVVLLGQQGDQRIDVHDMAQWADTDPRDILCALNGRVPRVFAGG